MEKKSIRNKYKLLRSALTTEEIEKMSGEIQRRFMEYLEGVPNIRHIHIFLPIKRLHEVNTFPLMFSLQKSGYHLYTSTVNLGSDSLDTLDITDVREFELDSWGIPVPRKAKTIEPQRIQMVLIPLLAYDKKGNRLGYGKGFYDKFLQRLDSKVLKIGLSYFHPEEKFTTEPHDIGLDICVTPYKIHHFV